MNQAEYWERVKSLFAAVNELPPDQQTDHLRRLCSDPRMRSDVLALLAADSEVTDWLDEGGLFRVRPEVSELPTDLEGQQVGRFKILHRIGSGGMGAVYLAEREDHDLKQQVALKVLQRGMVNDHAIARFLREREILARLDHPGICPLFDSGVTADGRPYFVMPFLEGALPLTAFCERKKLTTDERLVLFEQVCQAVHHAHQNLVVHGDLKSENVLVTPAGHVQLVDFGVSRLIAGEDGGLTATHGQQRPLSPNHASPEQIMGRAPTTSSDVYSLGILLYEVLGDRKPYELDAGADLHEQLTERSRPPRRTGRGAMPEDLYNICLKAMALKPGERYGSVMALAEDVQRWRDDRPVTARAPSWSYQLRKFVRRNVWPVATAGVGMVGVVVVAVVLAISATRTAQERDRAEATAEFWAHLFQQTDPVSSRDAATDVADLLDRAVEELTGESELHAETRGRLLGVISTAYWNMADHEQARRTAEASVAMFEGTDADPVERARAYQHLANIAISEIDVDAARLAADQALYWIERASDPEPEVMAAIIEADALVLEVEEKTVEAAEAMERAITHLERAPEASNRVALATSYGNLAYMYFNVARKSDEPEPWFELAEENVRMSLQILREHFGPEHPRVAFMLNAAGALNMERGRLGQALADFESAAEIADRTLPSGHEMLSYLNYNRAELNRRLGRTRQALEAYTATARAAASGLSKAHPRYREALVGKARTELALGEQQRAGETLEALSAAVAGLEPDDPARLWHEALSRRLVAAREGRGIAGDWIEEAMHHAERMGDPALVDYLSELPGRSP